MDIDLKNNNSWWQFDSSVDMDFANGQYFFGNSFANEADFLTAIGGVKTGDTYVIGPIDISDELMSDPNFDTGIIADGWEEGSGYATLGELSHDAGQLKVTRTATSQYRFGFPHTQAEMRAYKFSATFSNADAGLLTNPGSAMVATGANDANLWGSRAAFGFTNLPALPDDGSIVYGAEKTTFWSGLNTNVGITGDIWVDNCSLKEVAPFAGFKQNGTSFRIAGITPNIATGDKVVFQLDDESSERSRIRLVWDNSKHLRLIVTWAGAEQVNIDFGIIDINTEFEVSFAGKKAEIYTRLNNEASIFASPAQFPGLATLRLGRSYNGDNWDSTISRITGWAGYQPSIVIEPNLAFAVYGDSTAAAAGSSSSATQWYSLLYTGYTPNRIAYRNATGGQGIADMAADVIADEAHSDWLHIFYDRKNTGETADLWLAQIALAVTNLQTNRFLIMPQVPFADGAEDATNQLILDEINTRIRATYPNNTFTVAQETAFLSNLSSGTTRSDGLHRNDVGQAIEANTIRTWLDGKGW